MKHYIINKLIDVIVNNPIMVLSIIIGMLVGSFIANFVSWIPLIGSILGFLITLIFAIGAGVLSIRLKQCIELNKKL